MTKEPNDLLRVRIYDVDGAVIKRQIVAKGITQEVEGDIGNSVFDKRLVII